MSGDIAGHGIVWTASRCYKCCTIRALCGLALSSMNIGLSANAWMSKWGTTRGASTLSRYFWPVRYYHQERTSSTYSQRKNNPRQLHPHLYKIGTVVMTIWLIATKYQYLKWQWIFSFLRRCFLSSITDKHFTGMCCVFVFCVLYPMVSVSSVFAPGFK